MNPMDFIASLAGSNTDVDIEVTERPNILVDLVCVLYDLRSINSLVVDTDGVLTYEDDKVCNVSELPTDADGNRVLNLADGSADHLFKNVPFPPKQDLLYIFHTSDYNIELRRASAPDLPVVTFKLTAATLVKLDVLRGMTDDYTKRTKYATTFIDTINALASYGMVKYPTNRFGGNVNQVTAELANKFSAKVGSMVVIERLREITHMLLDESVSLSVKSAQLQWIIRIANKSNSASGVGLLENVIASEMLKLIPTVWRGWQYDQNRCIAVADGVVLNVDYSTHRLAYTPCTADYYAAHYS